MQDVYVFFDPHNGDLIAIFALEGDAADYAEISDLDYHITQVPKDVWAVSVN